MLAVYTQSTDKGPLVELAALLVLAVPHNPLPALGLADAVNQGFDMPSHSAPQAYEDIVGVFRQLVAYLDTAIGEVFVLQVKAVVRRGNGLRDIGLLGGIRANVGRLGCLFGKRAFFLRLVCGLQLVDLPTGAISGIDRVTNKPVTVDFDPVVRAAVTRHMVLTHPSLTAVFGIAVEQSGEVVAPTANPTAIFINEADAFEVVVDDLAVGIRDGQASPGFAAVGGFEDPRSGEVFPG